MVNKQVGDTVYVGVRVRNTGTVSHTFKIGLSIGYGNTWYQDYNDGYGAYRDVTISPGTEQTVQRTLSVPNDPNITDVWASVKDQNLNTLDGEIKFNEINVITANKLLITYCSSEDYYAANIIRNGLSGYFDITLKKGAILSEFGSYDMVAIVGGNFAWEGCSQNLYTLMGFASPTEIKNRCLRYGGYSGAVVYGIAGWSLSDTEYLANLFQAFAKIDNLPTATICY